MSRVNIFDENYKELQAIDWDFKDSKQEEISRLHPYPARFIESIPRSLISVLGVKDGESIFDPFCGSGTTLLEAQKMGIPSIGVDLNPIACLISRVKTQRISPAFLQIADRVCNNAFDQYEKGVVVAIDIPNLDHWFKKDVQNAIYTIVEQIDTLEDENTKDFLRFSLSSIIVRVSNQESDTRYAAIEKNTTGKDVFDHFQSTYRRVFSAKEKQKCKADSKVVLKDILAVKKEDVGNKVGLVITSPPYPNAYEYWLYHKYRMWWLGYDPIDVRKHEIGARPHYMKKNGQTEEDFRKQMDVVFELFQNCVVESGHVAFVIGRSIIKGKEIDNARLIRELASKRGFDIVGDIERTISASNKSFNLKYGKIKKENVLIFRKVNR